MAFRDRLPFQTQPETVERAPLYERLRRNVWMIGTTMLTFGGVLGAAAWLLALVPAIRHSQLVLLVAAVAVLVAAVLDGWLFRWGVERFDLVAPWQFREERVSSGGEQS